MSQEPTRDPERPGFLPPRRAALVIALVALGVFLFAVFESGLSHFSSRQTLTNHITFFLLINLNILLLLVFVFLVGRNLAKMIFERRRRILGSHLRTRLVVAFVGLSLVPTLLLFLTSTNFIDNSINKWFDVQVERPLEGAHAIVRGVYQEGAQDAEFEARELARLLVERGLVDDRRRLESFLEERTSGYRVDHVAYYSPDGTLRGSARGPGMETSAIPPPRSVLRQVLDSGRLARVVETVGEADLVRVALPVLDGERLVGAIVVDRRIPPSIARRAEEIARSYREFKELKILKQPIKNSYLLTLSLITLVILFAAIWYGFSLAKQITGPIQRLAEGAREVAQGNWDVRIERTGRDEIGTLVDAFNQMTADIRKTNSELDDRRRHMETVLGNLRGGVISVSAAGTVTTINAAAERLLGLTAERALDRSVAEVFAEPVRVPIAELLAEIAENGLARSERQVEILHEDQSVTLLVTVAPLVEPRGGHSNGAVLFFEDITEILKVQRMEAWREVAQRIAHEIKNPLTPIQLSAQRLHKRYAEVLDDDVFEECTRTIVNEVEGLKALVNEFSNFARLPTGNQIPEDLNRIVEEALVLFREAHREIRFDLESDADLPLLRLDRTGIHRAIVNVLDNAVAACGNGHAEAPRVEIRTCFLPSSRVVRLEIADNGVGMSPEVKARLFEPYFSMKKGGTGLGLAIVSAILADHRAYVRVRDNEPRGSRLVIEFPVPEVEDPAGESVAMEG